MRGVVKAERAAAPWQLHGQLRVTADGRYLEHADGAPFFWPGDTAWKIVRLKRCEVGTYLDNRRSKGFNVTKFNASCWPKEETPSYLGEYSFIGARHPIDSGWNQERGRRLRCS